ncbi:MaoC family dehydratase N-terminal domain-containing protein [Ramlibacter sp. WS9]|uniref:FAS1-like dehydratase domain-containing protein n=1 Tax=Ramlibacter sp. WS9 TaxID=1882741 RepID=UPI0011420CB3|nr:MaoC family dehydratase N-terminal domain-containing protein [Ramlibacter sp. WS9]ROZ68802.1 acyl-CoA dehydrogenase [Ramlibacter sp. WS9]
MTTDYADWIGREESRTERIDARPVQAMAATLDLQAAPQAGGALPAGWQWLFFNPMVARSGLGTDGHPQRGGFLPPIELPRRMWAGSRLNYLADIVVDALATRTSRIAKVENKVGKRGSLWFVTVEHTTTSEGRACIVEQQDIVYRDAAAPGAVPATTPERYDGVAEWGREIVPDTTLLFRYSALTFNGHRIHYDQPYARDEEGYAGLVVHGPLTATLLQQLAVEQGGGRKLARFEFRGVNPLIAGRAFRIEGRDAGDGTLALWARGPDGELAMSATAAFH